MKRKAVDNTVSRYVSFCKSFWEKTKLEQSKLKKLKMQLLIHYITEYILYSDNYLITRNQACNIARRIIYSNSEQRVKRYYKAVLRECLR